MTKKQKESVSVVNKAKRIDTQKVIRTVNKLAAEFNPTNKGFVHAGYRYKSNGKEEAKTGKK